MWTFRDGLAFVLETTPLIVAAAALILLRPALTVAWAFRGLDRMQVNAKATILERSIVLVGILLLVRGESHHAIWVPVSEVVAGLIMVAWLRRELNKRFHAPMHVSFKPAAWSAMISESWPISVAALMGSAFLYGDILLLGWFVDGATAAVYVVAHRLMLALVMPAQIITRASFPSVSRMAQEALERAIRLQGDLLRYLLLIILPVAIVVGAYAAEILAMVFGSQYSGAKQVLILLSIVVPIHGVVLTLENLLLALPRPRELLLSRVAASGIHLAVSILLIPQFGAEGAALGCLVGQLVFCLLAVNIIWRLTGDLPFSPGTFSPLLAGLFMLSAIVLFDFLGDLHRVSLSICVYLGAVFVFKALTVKELRGWIIRG
jgi:PST family polysaccharide transporter